MKFSFLSRAALAALVLGGAMTAMCPAQTTTNTSPVAPKLPPAVLDNDEAAQLQKARQQALKDNPSLQAEETKLKKAHADMVQGTATPDQKAAMLAEWKTYRTQIRAAMLKIDPTLGPIFAKLDKAQRKNAL